MMKQDVVSEIVVELYGRVQGVGFRRALRRFATSLGVTGWVENKEDGGVVVVLQGEKRKLEEVLAWIQEHPGLAQVTGVSYYWRDVGDVFSDFSIRTQDNFFVDQVKSFTNLGKKLLKGVVPQRVPGHVAIIPDGNRRWARKQGLSASFGHYQAGGVQNVLALIDEAERLGIRYLTFWGFSTENWKRNKVEVDALFQLILRAIPQLRSVAERKGIRFKHIGRRDRMPKRLVKALETLEDETAEHDGLVVQLALDYGGKDEILRAVRKLAGKKKITEKDISGALDTAGVPDVDLVIRTSGEQRTSGLLPWQTTYAEWYFVDMFFPDFGPRELRGAVEWFGKRVRRFGGNSSSDSFTKR
jgi:undecaprenyl diphosphate synthase